MGEGSEITSLAASLAEAIEWFVVDQFGMCERSHEIASAILAMPEMQAIRRFIKAYAESTSEDGLAVVYAYDALPASVDQWAGQP